MAKREGSFWIDGTDWHYVDENGQEWLFTGELVGTSVGRPGSFWVEGDNFHYVDENGDERYLYGASSHTDTGAMPGSYWVETPTSIGHWAWIDEAYIKRLAHGDHTDGAHEDMPEAVS